MFILDYGVANKRRHTNHAQQPPLPPLPIDPFPRVSNHKRTTPTQSPCLQQCVPQHCRGCSSTPFSGTTAEFSLQQDASGVQH